MEWGELNIHIECQPLFLERHRPKRFGSQHAPLVSVWRWSQDDHKVQTSTKYAHELLLYFHFFRHQESLFWMRERLPVSWGETTKRPTSSCCRTEHVIGGKSKSRCGAEIWNCLQHGRSLDELKWSLIGKFTWANQHKVGEYYDYIYVIYIQLYTRQHRYRNIIMNHRHFHRVLPVHPPIELVQPRRRRKRVWT